MSYRSGSSGDQVLTPQTKAFSPEPETSSTVFVWEAAMKTVPFATNIPSKLTTASTESSSPKHSAAAAISYSSSTALSVSTGVIFTWSSLISGTYSIHTVFQMPVVCTYQQAKFSLIQRCFPLGWRMSVESSTFTTSSFSPSRTRSVTSKEKREYPPL